MSPRRKLAVIVSVEVLALVGLVAFFAGVVLRSGTPAPLPGLVTAANTPSPGLSSTRPVGSTAVPASATVTPPALPAASFPADGLFA